MHNLPELFVVGLGAVLFLVISWGVKYLPSEGWQILAAIPREKGVTGVWRGLNLTYYGAFIASSMVFGLMMLIVLLGSVGITLLQALAVAVPIIIFCIPLSRLIALIVEKRRGTFTMGGAGFVGFIIAPWVVLGINSWQGETSRELSVIAALAVMTIAYAFGEGLGRLACISFGCCYGKPLEQTHPAIAKFFSRMAMVFTGETKKISWDGGLEGERVIPIQAVTASIYVGTALVATLLFLRGHDTSAFVLAAVTTQGWRVLSETLRADFRGKTGISSYQLMALLLIPYSLGLALFFGELPAQAVDLISGVAVLWDPSLILALQLLWIGCFYYYGRSVVTGSTLRFHINRN